MRRGVVCALVGALTLATCSSTVSTTAAGQGLPGTGPPGPTPTLHWHACDKSYLCSQLSVPLDYAHPDGAQIKLAVVERPASGAHPLGDVLMNPGGPGASGVQFIEGYDFPASLSTPYNLISWDPRGVGQSEPVQCLTAVAERSMIASNPVPATPSQVAVAVAEAKQFDAACLKNTPMSLLENLSTTDTARDMDQLRAALGLSQLNYLGFSYGTYLGELYAEMYPSNVRAMVLDGVINPALSVTAFDEDQAAGFEADLNDFFAWCPTNKACKYLLPVPRHSLEELMTLAESNQLDANLGPDMGGTQPLTPGLALTAVVGLLYSDQTWPDLASAIAFGAGGDGSELALDAYAFNGMMPNGQFNNLDAANVAISCADRGFAPQLSYYETLAARLKGIASEFGAAEAWSDLNCAYWPVKAPDQASAVQISGAPTVLLIGSTGDPATPYEWAKEVASQLGSHARLLTRVGPGHTGYFYSVCVQHWVALYVANLELPPQRTTCPSSS